MSESAAEHLVASLFLRPSDFIAMFTGYFDESYQEGGFVVAGVVCHSKQFVKLDRKWRSMLKEFEIEGGFHMKEFVARHHKERSNQYTDWPIEKEIRFFNRMAGIISKHTVVSIGVVLDKKIYEDFRKGPGIQAVFENPYETTSWICLNVADDWAKKRRRMERLNFVFDRGNEHGGAFKAAYDGAYAGRDYFGDFTFADDLEVLPLQAADFLAWELGKAWTSHTIDGRKMRKSYLHASKLIKKNWRVVNTPTMLYELASALGVHTRPE